MTLTAPIACEESALCHCPAQMAGRRAGKAQGGGWGPPRAACLAMNGKEHQMWREGPTSGKDHQPKPVRNASLRTIRQSYAALTVKASTAVRPGPPSNSSTHLLAPSDNSRLLDNSLRGSGCKIVRPGYMCILCRHHDIKVGQAVITDDRNRGRSCHASGPWQGKRQRARTGDWCHLLGPGCLGVGQVCSFLLSSKSSVL